MMYPDIYYMPQWGELYGQKDEGQFEYYTLENEYGYVLYPYVKRECPVIYKKEIYYDIITPFGFNGPYMNAVSKEAKRKLQQAFEEDFNQYCNKQHIVAEYIRFSPWLKNYEDFKLCYTLKFNGQTVEIDLKKEDLLRQCSRMRKYCIKKAIKSDVQVSFDFEGDSVEGLYSLYEKTFNKNDIAPYYHYSLPFLKEHFKTLKNHVFIGNAFIEDQLISSAMFIYDQNNIHYHIAGNDYEYIHMNGNSLLLYKAMEWGKAQGMKWMHLAGGSKVEQLMQFKLSFTDEGATDYYVGWRIRQKDVYEGLIKATGINNPNYFPAYKACL